ncbi:MAG TPA: UdgX family uracil-DNA binding protein [Candidatus Baltobacteraceae bacterium]|nr:UdgX family uracil-DNA binding protein [Candidatus Baltobacteraceae bacterium]
MARSAAEFLPQTQSMKALREAAAHCRGCDLYKYVTQTVFGEGGVRSRVMLVGEQPGDMEDRTGHPFVGPAGTLLRKAMVQAGIEPSSAYITNAVKHFKFIERGKKRIHQKPKTIEIRACEPWLEAELRRVHPQVVVALGATAAQALLGNTFRLTKHRGEVLSSPLASRVVATVHPSAILRTPDSENRRRELAKFVEDLQHVASLLQASA